MRRLALALLLSSTLAASGCRGRPRSWDVPVESDHAREGAPAVLEFDLGAGAPEKTAGGLFTLPSRYTFDNLVAALHQAEARTEVRGVFVGFGTASLGWSRAHELGDALVRLREKNKIPIVCHADAWDNTSYAAAARGCDTIAMSPGGEVEATGPAASIPYARELLEDRLHAQVDILQVGKFKGAAEPLTRDGPSEEYKASIERALGAIAASNREALAVRHVDALIGTGPYMGAEAKEQKLVDELLDRRAAREALRTKAGGAPIDVVYGPGSDVGGKPGLLDLLKLFAQNGNEAAGRPHLRLLRLHGEITLGSEGGLFGGQGGIVARKLVEQVRRLENDSNVRAIVLRIDSPGGSALGSDLAWIAVHALSKKKPVIVSIGEMAASGGYYIASAANVIYAEPESIVGSVGVVGGKVAFGGTMAMVGVHTASFGDKRAAQLGSLSEPWDAETRARLLGSMTRIYELFLDRVAEGRNKPRSAFDEAVEGRVFGGAQAKELDLVDRIGGLGDALAAAKKDGGLPEDAPIVSDDAPVIGDVLGMEEEASSIAPLPAEAPVELFALRRWVLAFARSTRGGGVAAMVPAPWVLR